MYDRAVAHRSLISKTQQLIDREPQLHLETYNDTLSFLLPTDFRIEHFNIAGTNTQLENFKEIQAYIDNLINWARESIEKNRQILVPIINTIVLAGHLGLALRGHRQEPGALVVSTLESDNRGDEGNLRALLQFKALSGDTVLSEHLASCRLNASYISWSSQNEIINLLGEQLQSTLVKRVQEAKFYTVIADETTDLSRKPPVEDQGGLSLFRRRCGPHWSDIGSDHR